MSLLCIKGKMSSRRVHCENFFKYFSKSVARKKLSLRNISKKQLIFPHIHIGKGNAKEETGF
jgi:hypothetical protein